MSRTDGRKLTHQILTELRKRAVAAFSVVKVRKMWHECFHLPPYSPELNPDERVWNDLKNNAVDRQSIATPQQLHSAIMSHFRLIKKSPERVRAYYKNEEIKYAA